MIATYNQLVHQQSPLAEDAVDYIFTDPPFGENIMYSELNFLVGIMA